MEVSGVDPAFGPSTRLIPAALHLAASLPLGYYPWRRRAVPARFLRDGLSPRTYRSWLTSLPRAHCPNRTDITWRRSTVELNAPIRFCFSLRHKSGNSHMSLFRVRPSARASLHERYFISPQVSNLVYLYSLHAIRVYGAARNRTLHRALITFRRWSYWTPRGRIVPNHQWPA